MRTIIAYHDNCLDGFLAAMFVYAKAIYDGYPSLYLMPVNYNSRRPVAATGDHLIVVDFCFKPEDIKHYINCGVNLTIVDHHETQVDLLKAAGITEHQRLLRPGTYHTCNRCDYKNNHLFTKLVPAQKLYPDSGVFNAYLSDNRSLAVHYRDCGASSTYMLLKDDPDFYKFMVSFLTVARPGINRTHELERTLELARTHDLWLHDGTAEHEATALGFWFKAFSREHKEKREQMTSFPFNSFKIFATMKNAFQLTPLHEKISQGKELIEAQMPLINYRCGTAKPVFFHTMASSKNVRFGAMTESLQGLDISLVGSTLVKRYGYDVAVMNAFEDDEKVTFSLRSDQYGSNYNVGALADRLVKTGIAIVGGGHRNAAGFTIDKQKISTAFR